MSIRHHAFAIGGVSSLSKVHQQLKKWIEFESDKPNRISRTFFDTFDWRLFHAGLSLEQETGQGGTGSVVLRSLAEHRAIVTIPNLTIPSFAQDIASGPLKSRVADILQMRALKPTVSLRGQQLTGRVLDKESKVLFRVTVEEMSVVAVGGYRPLASRLRIQPIRGYEKHAERFERAARKRLDLYPDADSLMMEALAAADVVPGLYTDKPEIALRPELRADAAVKLILSRLFEVMCQNEAGVIQDIDSEFLHDYRVAIRRSRSALSQLKGVFPAATTRRYNKLLAALGQKTGPTRDLDVYLLKYPDYVSQLPNTMAADLAPLHTFLQRHQRDEQTKLAAHLKSPDHRQFMERWQRFLQVAVPIRPSAPQASLSIKTLADQRLRRIYRRVLREGTAIDPNTPAEALHTLRKSCKKLRYLLEFTRSLYPEKQMNHLIRALKRLQDNLGDFQDFEVQADTMKVYETTMSEEMNVPEQTFEAMDYLIEHLHESQAEVRREFERTFAEFASEDNQKVFHSLLAGRSSR